MGCTFTSIIYEESITLYHTKKYNYVDLSCDPTVAPPVGGGIVVRGVPLREPS
jgi:hypothetical protein